jgi:hypothetical protein
MRGLMLCLLLAGCNEPVAELGPQPAPLAVTSCRGDCPSGQCDDACASLPEDGGCSTPEQCLTRDACRREQISVGCAAYARRDTPFAECGTAGFVFCMTLSSDAGFERYANDCRFGAPRVTSCHTTCDGGSPSGSCREICGASYCVR